MGLTQGLNNNRLSSPMGLVTGNIGTHAGPPVTADGATASSALNAVATPLKVPLSGEGSFAGANGGSQQARSGATAAMLNHPTNGAGSW
jgi:hypothetical protein